MRSNERRLKVRIAIARYLDGDYEGAIDAAQRVIRSYPEFPLIYRWLAAALGQGSRTEEAPQASTRRSQSVRGRSTCTSAGARRGTARRLRAFASRQRSLRSRVFASIALRASVSDRRVRANLSSRVRPRPAAASRQREPN